MAERHRELVETEEFTAQLDEIVRRHSADVIVPVLAGILDGIAKKPSAFPQTLWGTRLARSDNLGLTIPIFRIIFQIQEEGTENERVLLLWIQEDPTLDEITGLVM